MSIRTEGMDVGYGKVPLIRNISVLVEPKKIFTLIGPNGSGKSTVLKSIAGQLKKMGGAVYLDGEDMEGLTRDRIAKGMSVVMTERPRTELMSCREVVATGRYPYTGRLGILSSSDWDIVDSSLKLVKAEDIAGRDFLKISDGQRQRVMLARAVCQDTGTLVLDEPVSFLDMRYKLDILVNIRKMARERHLAVIMSLHELDLAQKVSDIVACVEGEEIKRIGTPEEIFTGDFIQKLYGVSAECYDPILGNMYLPGNRHEPEIFVIGGGGSGIPVYYDLQRKGIPFAAGVLCENDLEYNAAKALASQVIASKAFYFADDALAQQGKAAIDRCKACICTLKCFGPVNEKNKELLEYAVQTGKLKRNVEDAAYACQSEQNRKREY